MVGRLPKESFAKRMLAEALSLALAHLHERLTESGGNLTLGSDGTSKHELHYGSATVSFPDGQTMMLGLSDMAFSDAESYRSMILDMISDVAETENPERKDWKVKSIGKLTIKGAVLNE
jgi:hypothetical protein